MAAPRILAAQPDMTVGLDQEMASAIQATVRVIEESETPDRTLVVAGVDASAESLAAAHYAVASAAMRGGEVAWCTPFRPHRRAPVTRKRRCRRPGRRLRSSWGGGSAADRSSRFARVQEG